MMSGFWGLDGLGRFLLSQIRAERRFFLYLAFELLSNVLVETVAQSRERNLATPAVCAIMVQADRLTLNPALVTGCVPAALP